MALAVQWPVALMLQRRRKIKEEWGKMENPPTVLRCESERVEGGRLPAFLPAHTGVLQRRPVNGGLISLPRLEDVCWRAALPPGLANLSA